MSPVKMFVYVGLFLIVLGIALWITAKATG
jgi:hypothetical protein